jgi:DNA repair exonuclease SbcCD ATPase subunit
MPIDYSKPVAELTYGSNTFHLPHGTKLYAEQHVAAQADEIDKLKARIELYLDSLPSDADSYLLSRSLQTAAERFGTIGEFQFAEKLECYSSVVSDWMQLSQEIESLKRKLNVLDVTQEVKNITPEEGSLRIINHAGQLARRVDEQDERIKELGANWSRALKKLKASQTENEALQMKLAEATSIVLSVTSEPPHIREDHNPYCSWCKLEKVLRGGEPQPDFQAERIKELEAKLADAERKLQAYAFLNSRADWPPPDVAVVHPNVKTMQPQPSAPKERWWKCRKEGCHQNGKIHNDGYKNRLLENSDHTAADFVEVNEDGTPLRKDEP